MPKKSVEVSCAFCPKSYCNQQIYYKHANRDHFQDVSDTWYPCELCQMFLPTTDVLKKHRACVHSIKEAPARIQCTFCEKTHCNTHEFYKHANRLHTEQVLKQWFPCEDCKIYFPDEDVLKNHTFQAHSNSGNEIAERVTCPHCPKHFSRTVEFYKHVNNAHLSLIIMEWLQCNQCEMFFPRQDVLERHASRVHSVRKLSQRAIQCIFCDQAFIRLEEYYRHANEYHKEVVDISWEKCPDCQVLFPDGLEVERHRLEEHAQGSVDLVQPTGSWNHSLPKKRSRKQKQVKKIVRIDGEHGDTDQSFSSTDWVKCNECDLFFPGPQFLNLHQAIMHPSKIANSLLPESSPTNGYTEKLQHKMNDDEKPPVTNTNWLPCNECGRIFPSQLILNAHKSFVHPEVADHSGMDDNLAADSPTPQCPYCQSRFDDDVLLQQHIDGCNTSVKTTKKSHVIKCRFCSHQFVDFDMYFLHANAVHAERLIGEWLKCDECPLFFPSDTRIQLHKEKSHSQILPDVSPESTIKIEQETAILEDVQEFHENFVDVKEECGGESFHVVQIKTETC